MTPAPSPSTLDADPAPRTGGETEVFRPRVLGWSVGLLIAPVLAGLYLLLAPARVRGHRSSGG